MTQSPSSEGITTATSPMKDQANGQFAGSEALFESLAAEYATGQIDIPQIAQRLGAPWSEAEVILRLEQGGIHRSLDLCEPAPELKNRVLNRLASIRAESQAGQFDSPHAIEREVTASQRIESVYVQPEDFTR
jgi:hypothetical protein